MQQSPDEEPQNQAPDTRDETLAHCKHLIATGQAEAALPPLQQLTEQAPQLAEGWFLLGLAYRELHRYEDALAAFERTLAREPKHAWALASKSYVLANMQRYAEDSRVSRQIKALPLDTFQRGLKQVEQMLAINANYQYGWYSKGSLLLYQNLFAKALKAFEQALTLNPSDPSAWNDKGGALSRLGRYEEALDAYNHSLAIIPSHAIAWSNTGTVLSKMKRYGEALHAYEQALTLNPAFTISWTNKGWAHYRIAQYSDALVAFDRALVFDPAYANAWNGKGWSHFHMKQYQMALDAFDHALFFDPTDTDIMEGRTKTLAALTLRTIGRRLTPFLRREK
jgi:tetratricopeptide (TPR) repeat protein